MRAELQNAAGDKAIYLSGWTAAGLLGINATYAWKLLRLLVMDGVLRVTEPGKQPKATRYRYLGDSLETV